MEPTPTPAEATAGSASLRISRQYLGQHVTVTIDRPYGTAHPVHGFRYEADYGYVPGTLAPDGEELDAYLLGPTQPLDHGEGSCVGIIHRLDDDDDKLVVIPTGYHLTDDEILAAVAFQERPGCHELLRPTTRA
jgi:inorganic pyrophosphatase